MARLCFTFLIILALTLMVSRTESQTCTSQSFTKGKVFTNCTDLPYLNAYLHWTYNATNSSLSIAYIAPTANPDGWVSWAINPNSTGMAGAQALLAFKFNGVMTIKTYNIVSYNFTTSGFNLSYDVWDLSTENSNGTITIFAQWKLKENTEKVNQVWQVGPGVTPQGWPMKHNYNPENLNSYGTLQLVKAEGPVISPAYAPQPVASGHDAPAPTPSGSSRIKERVNVGVCLNLFVILASLIAF
ncbi:hypothetical protein ACJW30_12G162700 [Castanea mollissima]